MGTGQAYRRGRAEADKHCWGPDSCYLKQALAAYCDITAGQMARMTWEEIAAALKHAVDRRAAASTSARAAAPGPPMPRLASRGRWFCWTGRPCGWK